jgi:hypothetical protein
MVRSAVCCLPLSIVFVVNLPGLLAFAPQAYLTVTEVGAYLFQAK